MNFDQKTIKPVVLCILDGWGYREEKSDNAIYEADTPVWDKLISNYPNSLLKTSGRAVGLSDGQMGNSEVGHMNIGSGRIVQQNLPRIDLAFEDGSIGLNEKIVKLIDNLKQTGGKCHIMGLMSPGGVHSHQDHIAKFSQIIAKENIEVKIHAFLDGRDTPPESAISYIEKFEQDTTQYSNIEISTIAGRYYAMDRDNRWDRVKLAYDAIILADGPKYNSASEAIYASYEQKNTDEFVLPAIIGDFTGIEDGDAVVMLNFRSDRVRQILQSILDPDFDGFERNKFVNLVDAIGIVEYSDHLNKFLQTIFKPQLLNNILGDVIEQEGLSQLRIAETEKYAHVTFFFNGGKENQYNKEDRILVPSPKVSTYDLQPEMSAHEVTDKLILAINSDKYDLIIVNYANTDMVGHTGVKEAAIKAVETVDKCLDKLVEAVKNKGGAILITADHGNVEQMVSEDGKPHTSHTTGPVPFIMAGEKLSDVKVQDGSLCDIAPTILKILGLNQPEEMKGKSLVL